MSKERFSALLFRLFFFAAMSGEFMVSCGGDSDEGEASEGGTTVPDDKTPVHDYVFLDTSDGTLWATTNIGATLPHDKGSHFAWAETGQKSVYSWDTYRYAEGYQMLTKYCALPNFGFEGYTDDVVITELESADDAATELWGREWQMPSLEQWERLIEECNWKWEKQGGIYGYRVYSRKSPQKNIFLPAAGRMSFGSSDYAGEMGYYWSRTLDTGTPTYAYAFHTSSSNSDMVCLPSMRFLGFSVRPVRVGHQDVANGSKM